MKDEHRGLVFPGGKPEPWALEEEELKHSSCEQGVFYFICMCDHETKLPPAARQRLRFVLTGSYASGVNPVQLSPSSG